MLEGWCVGECGGERSQAVDCILCSGTEVDDDLMVEGLFWCHHSSSSVLDPPDGDGSSDSITTGPEGLQAA